MHRPPPSDGGGRVEWQVGERIRIEAVTMEAIGNVTPLAPVGTTQRVGRTDQLVGSPNGRKRLRDTFGEPIEGGLFDPDSDSDLDALLTLALDGGLEVGAGDFGNIQLLDHTTGALRIAVQAGFGQDFLDYFASVEDSHSSCGRAMLLGAQTVVTDVQEDPDFTPHREIAEAAGFRAVQSTPLVDHGGRLVGVLSTHYRWAGRPPESDLHALRVYGRLAGEALAQACGHHDAGQRVDGARAQVVGTRPRANGKTSARVR